MIPLWIQPVTSTDPIREKNVLHNKHRTPFLVIGPTNFPPILPQEVCDVQHRYDNWNIGNTKRRSIEVMLDIRKLATEMKRDLRLNRTKFSSHVTEMQVKHSPQKWLLRTLFIPAKNN